MPIYEEKLISPFAIHFTQEHIRTTFRDGRDVEVTRAEVTAQPAEEHIRTTFRDGRDVEVTRAEVTAQPAEDPEHFDLVLHVPFPCIEIMRWRTPRRPNHRSAYANDMVETHWYTLDNRRLYCLQAVAAAHWPKRVGAIVEILYADPGTIRRKYDSTTFGRSVSLAHSIKDGPITRWDWRTTVMSKNADPDMVSRALEAVTADDKKRTVQELNDADTNNDQLRRLEEAAVAADRKPALQDAAIWRVAKVAPVVAGGGHSASSTTTPASAEISEEEEDFVVCPRRALGGPWQGGPGEFYRVLAPEGTSRWICTLEGGPRPPKHLLFYDAEEHVVWWGKERSFFVDAREVGRECSEVRWYAKGDESRYPHFVWKRPDDTATSQCGTADVTTLAERAIADIVEQLRKPESNGRVSLPNWNKQYGKSLGTLRHFVQSRPDTFIVSSGLRLTLAHQQHHDKAAALKATRKDQAWDPSA